MAWPKRALRGLGLHGVRCEGQLWLGPSARVKSTGLGLDLTLSPFLGGLFSPVHLARQDSQTTTTE